MLIMAAALLVQPARLEEARSGAACIVGRLDAAQREAMVAPVLRGEDLQGAVAEAFDAAVGACATNGGWSEARAADSSAMSAMLLAADSAGSRLRAAGINPARIDAWFVRQPKAVRTNLQVEERQIRGLFTALNRSGVQSQTLEQEGATIGQYLATLIVAARIREGMSLD